MASRSNAPTRPRTPPLANVTVKWLAQKSLGFVADPAPQRPRYLASNRLIASTSAGVSWPEAWRNFSVPKSTS